jgi:hydroxypyruvate reductase
LAHPATLISLILSDVVGDPLDVIASGPTVGDPTTYKECQEVLDRYALKDKLPASVKSHLEQGIEGKVPETPKPGEPIFSQTLSILVGTNMQALKAATNQAEKLGYTSLTTEAARFHTALAKEIVMSGHPVVRPACLISGGETTVVVRGRGKGGRNQHFALEAALELEGLEGVCLLSGGTDGTDGPSWRKD